MRHRPRPRARETRPPQVDLDAMSYKEAIAFVAELITDLAASRKHGISAAAAAMEEGSYNIAGWLEDRFPNEPFMADAYYQIVASASEAVERIR